MAIRNQIKWLTKREWTTPFVPHSVPPLDVIQKMEIDFYSIGLVNVQVTAKLSNGKKFVCKGTKGYGCRPGVRLPVLVLLVETAR